MYEISYVYWYNARSHEAGLTPLHPDHGGENDVVELTEYNQNIFENLG